MKLSYQGNSLTCQGLAGYASYTIAQPASALYYSSTNIISAKGKNVTVYENINVATTSYNYQVITFEEAGLSAQARDWYIEPHSWRARQHKQVGNYKGIRAYGTFTAENPDVAERYIDKEYLRYYKPIKETQWAYFKFITDQSADRASAFWNDNYLGYGTVSHVTGVTTVGVKAEQSLNGNISARNFTVAGFANLDEAAAWTGYRLCALSKIT